MQVLHFIPELQKEFVLGDFVFVSEGTEPDEFRLQAVEGEAAEQAVLGIGDERENLVGRAGNEGGQPVFLDEDPLSVLAPCERDVLVVEGFAEAI